MPSYPLNPPNPCQGGYPVGPYPPKPGPSLDEIGYRLKDIDHKLDWILESVVPKPRKRRWLWRLFRSKR